MKVKLPKSQEVAGTPVLDRLGVSVGTQVRFRRREEEHWIVGTVRADFKDGSVTIVDKDGRWCSIMPEKIQIAHKGPRGGRFWRPLTEPKPK